MVTQQYTLYLLDVFKMYSEDDVRTEGTYATYDAAVARAKQLISAFISDYGTSEYDLATAYMHWFESPIIAPGPTEGPEFDWRAYYDDAKQAHFLG